MYKLSFITLLLSLQKSMRMKRFNDTNSGQLKYVFFHVLVNRINCWKESLGGSVLLLLSDVQSTITQNIWQMR